MSRVLLAGLSALCLFCGFSAGADLYPWPEGRPPGPKPEASVAVHQVAPGPRLDGDTPETAIPISSLPFLDSGNTCEFTDDYDEVCPYAGSTSPDVFYSYVPTADLLVDLDLCSSFYDTKVYVYEDEAIPGTAIACNDDACGSDGWKSKLMFVPFYAGHTYYIAVDGYGGDCGDYSLWVLENLPCCVDCPPGAILEGEPDCYDGYVDQFNNGCCCGEYHFSYLDPMPGEFYVCGTSGTFLDAGMNMRDSDWYEINTSEATTLSYCGVAEFPVQLILIDGRDGCENMQVMDVATGEPYMDACIEHEIEPGRYWLWVGPQVFSGVPCGSDYVLTINGYHSGVGRAPDGAATHPAASLSCRPDPFASRTSISYALTAAARARLTVHHPGGRILRTLVDAPQAPGRHEVIWDGRDDLGRPVGSGVYFCRLQAGGSQSMRSVVVIR